MAGALQDAKTYLVRAQILDEKSAGICNKLGVVCEQLGEYDEAFKQFKTAIQFDADNENTHLALADLLSRMQRFEEAKIHYARSIEIDDSSDTAYFNFARMLESAGDATAACEKYRRTLQLNPAHMDAKAALARCSS